MLDIRIAGARVVDGTGRPAFRADVGIRGGRIVEIGATDEPAARTIDADGLVLTPGFVDLHTHYDAQLFWDPYCTPSPLHGVTTVIGGNCGLTLAPLEEGDEAFLLGVFSRVESIPRQALESGLSFDWRSFPEMMGVLAAHPLGINFGLLAGHTAIRRAIMGDAASERAATGDELAAMRRAVNEALDAGALGFSTATARAHVDLDGRPTPPHFADVTEMIELAATTRHRPGTSLEFIPGSAQDGFSDDDVELLRAMAAAGRRPINWNLLQFSRTDPDLHHRQLRASAFADGSDAGADSGRVIALMLPNNPRMRIDFGPNNVGLRLVPACTWLFELPASERLAALADPETRAHIAQALRDPSERVAAVRETMPDWILNDGAGPEAADLVGCSAAEIAVRRGVEVLDAVLDLAVASRGAAGFTRRVYLQDRHIAATRRSLLTDPRVVLGGSDAGAHVDAMANGEYPSAALAELVREQEAIRLEDLVHLLTQVPAQLVGLTDRGTIALGWPADLVLLDPARVGPSDLAPRADLPGGRSRLYSAAEGIHYVLVNGVPIVEAGVLTGAHPGALLRSGAGEA